VKRPTSVDQTHGFGSPSERPIVLMAGLRTDNSFRPPKRRQMAAKPKLLSVIDFARIAGISYYSARQMVRLGQIPGVPVGRRIRIHRKWVRKAFNK
jgi:hypothetical protein